MLTAGPNIPTIWPQTAFGEITPRFPQADFRGVCAHFSESGVIRPSGFAPVRALLDQKPK